MIGRILKLCSAVASAVVLTACAENTQSINGVRQMAFTASCADYHTRTQLVDNVKVYWENGDAIAVSGASEPFVTALDAPSATAEFHGEAVPAEVYHAVYPFDAVNEMTDEIASLHLPARQPAVKGAVAPGLNISVSSSDDLAKSFCFRSIIGLIRINIGTGTGRVNSITVTANGSEALAGNFILDFSSDNPMVEPKSSVSEVVLSSDSLMPEGDYYVALLPGTYDLGLTFTFAGPDGTTVRTVSEPVVIERGYIQDVCLDDMEGPSDAAAFYTKVQKSYGDWSGDYLITYTASGTIKVFDSFDGSDKGRSEVDLYPKLTSEGIPAADAGQYKAVLEKVGSHYSVNISGVGYIGLESSGNKVHRSSTAPSSSDTKYLWELSYKNGGLWLVNAYYTSRRLQWNESALCFRCYEGSQKELTLYRRTSSTGSVTPSPDPTPDPEPDPEPDPGPDPTPDPEPDPDPDIPDPVPGISGKYAWYELPEISYTQSGNYLVDSTDDDLYYAHHLCAGNEKGPGGKKARNYTVCFSAEHHCPVWVAAPRHKMYQSGASRTDAYAKDPDIPSDIQYNSKSTGGSCNKGHMLGSAERLSSTATNKQVFYYSNIAPQYSSTFNTGGGGWNTLEDWVDGQVCSDTLYVVIGAYFEKYTDRRGYTDAPKTISFGGRSDVTRPSMFYYILLRTKNGNSGKPLSQCSADEIKCAAFVRSHATPKGVSVGEKDMMSVSDLEKLTGFTYFPNVPQAPKDSYKASDWGL